MTTDGLFDYFYSKPMPGAGPNRAGHNQLFRMELNEEELRRLLRRVGPELRRKVSARLVSHNARMARELSELAADLLAQRMVRRRVSTGTLRNAILARQNRSYSSTGFGVGHPAFLDSSQAKYWRTIERGSDYFVGKPIRGVWAATLGGGPFSGMGESTGGRLVPLRSRRSAAAFLADEGVRSQDRTRIVTRFQGVIRKPIPAHRYFHDAWEQYDPVRAGSRAINQVLREVLSSD